MQQRCTGCSSCQSTSTDAGPPPATTPTASAQPPLPTPGKLDRDKAKALVDEQATAKSGRDQLESALKEIRNGTGLEFHRKKSPDVLKKAAKALGLSEAGVLADWDWFLKNGPPSVKPRADEKSWAAHV